MPSQGTQPTSATDLAIVGAGPVGLFAAYYAGFRRMSVKVIDSLHVPGGQLTALYPEKAIYDVAGHPEVGSKELVARLVKQSSHYAPVFCLGERVQKIDQDDSGDYTLATQSATHAARAIILAVGIGAFEAKRLALSAAARFEGLGLAYSLAEPQALGGKRVLIVGGGDAAVSWATTLASVAAQVTLIHRHDVFHASATAVAALHQTAVRVHAFHELIWIEGRSSVERVKIADNRTDQSMELNVDCVLANLGFESSLAPIKDWDVTLEGSQIRVDGTMRTSRPRIYAAGDGCTYPGKLKLIATGFGEACIAVNHIKRDLDPSARLFPGHSSEAAR